MAYGISVPSTFQTPGQDIAANLASFKNLKVLNGDGTEPTEAASLIKEAVAHVRSGEGPALLRLRVPRLQGHSFQDTQTYKSKEFVEAEWARDPLPKLKAALVPHIMSEKEWEKTEQRAADDVEAARAAAEALPTADPASVATHVFSGDEQQVMGGLRGDMVFCAR